VPESKIIDRADLIKSIGNKVFDGELPIAAYERQLFLLLLLFAAERADDHPVLHMKSYRAAERMFIGAGKREGVQTPEVCTALASAFPNSPLADKAIARLAMQSDRTAPAAVAASR